MPFRFDVGSITNVERTPQGGIVAPAFLTRSGVFVYRRADGSEVREYRPPEEVFNADSLRSLNGAPVTDNHPPRSVTPENFRTYARGHVETGSIKRQDDGRIGARLIIQDKGLIDRIERSDAREVSCGYSLRIEETPGETPEGERYDRVQRGITYNHVAIVSKGRAGSSVRLRLDSDGNQIEETTKETKMISIRIDGVDYPLGTEAEQTAAAQAYARANQAQTEQIQALSTERDQHQARADAAESRVKELEAASSDEVIAAAVQAALQLRSDCAPILGKDYSFDGKPVAEVRRDAVAAVFPKLSLEDRSDDYMLAMYDAALQTFEDRKDSDGVSEVRRKAHESQRNDAQTQTQTSPATTAKKKLRKDNAEAWQKDLAITK